MRCDDGVDSARVGFRECLCDDGGGELKLVSCGHVSPCDDQVALGGPPYGRHVDLMVGGDTKGIVYGGVDLARPRPAEIVVSREVTKHNYYTRVGWLGGSFAGVAG